MTITNPILVISGPTSAGKSVLAIDLAQALNGIVINADSMQVYQELRIVTARPSIGQEKIVPHRLYGILPAAKPCSAILWQKLAIKEIQQAWEHSCIPIVVGGTGMYLKALTEGLSVVPHVPENIRATVSALHTALGRKAFHARLAALDPKFAARLPDGDTQRQIRAYEVALATGQPLSEWQKIPISPPLPEAQFGTIALIPPRNILYNQCYVRIETMLKEGILDEIAALDALNLNPTLPAMKAVGVSQFLALHRGKATLEETCEKVARETRHYIKRQMTWIRHQMAIDLTLKGLYNKLLSKQALAYARKWLEK